MKKSILFLVAIGILAINPAVSQGLLNKVKNVESKGTSGNKDNSSGNKATPEPKCACENAVLVMDLGGKFKIFYNEMSVYMKDDGSLLVYDKIENKYYISKNGVTDGPYSSEDKIVQRKPYYIRPPEQGAYCHDCAGIDFCRRPQGSGY